MKVLLRILNGAITVTLVLVLVGAAGLAISARRSRDAMPTVMGYKILTVLSGSMTPVIHTGDIVVVRPLLPDEPIREGAIVTFRTKERADMLITHRVIGTVWVNDRPTAFVTKGDANDAPDQTPLVREQVLGFFRWRVPYMGYVLTFLHKPVGIIVGVIVPGLLVLGLELRQLWRLAAEAEANQSAGR